MDTKLVKQGLVGLARAGGVGWFPGHFGAASIASHYLTLRSDLSPDAKGALVRHLEEGLVNYRHLFAPFADESPTPHRIDEIAKALEPLARELHISGHGTIYGALALRALRDFPQLATPSIVEGVVKLLEKSLETRAGRFYGVPDYSRITVSEAEIPRYRDSRDMIRTSFREAKVVYPDRILNGQTFYFAAEKLHSLTYAHALLTLETMGYTDLASGGWEQQRRQVKLSRMLPPGYETEVLPPVNPQSPHDPSYWDRDHFDDHSLKLAYAALELLEALPQEDRDDLYSPFTFWSPFRR